MAKDRKAVARGKGAAKSTVSGPTKSARGADNGPAERKMQGAQELAAAFPYNASKPGEIGAAARTPKPGATVAPRVRA
jgi:catalase